MHPPSVVSPGRIRDAQVAQLVEHATENRSVGGSIPPLGTILKSLVFLAVSDRPRSTFLSCPDRGRAADLFYATSVRCSRLSARGFHSVAARV
jgi:hypothetical protein